MNPSPYNLSKGGGDLSVQIKKRVDDEPHASPEQFVQALQHLRGHLLRRNLKQSSKRESVLRIFLDTPDHPTIEELHRAVRAHDPTIGYTTVYRSLKLFTECGLATEVEFHDGFKRFEHGLNRRAHHHMVCTQCGDSVEFFAPAVEQVERRIGRQFHFIPARHNFQIYGTCKACQKKPTAQR